MRHFLFIIVLTVCFADATFAQQVTKKKLFIYPPLRSWFFERPSLKEIGFSWDKHGMSSLTTYTSPSSADTTRYYDLSFPGDRYLFNKLYGQFDFPDSLIQKEVNDRAVHYSFSGTVRQDSIFLTEYFYFPEKDVQYFDKVEILAGYAKGKSALGNELQAAIKDIPTAEKLTDSVFIFKCIISPRDSSYTHYGTIISPDDVYATAFVNTLSKSRPWKPSYSGGRPVKAYIRIYIRINKDGSITVDYPE